MKESRMNFRRLHDDERAVVANAIATLTNDGLDEEGCYCNDPSCSVENPQCNGNMRRNAVETLRSLISPQVTTRHAERLNSTSERIYFEAAQSLAEEKPGINSGYSTLAHILNPNLRKSPPPVSRDEAQIIGTFAQWLGTNCGHCFILECERRIEKERADRSAWLIDSCTPFPESDWCTSHARRLLDLELPGDLPERERLVRRIGDAFEQMMLVLAVRVGAISGDSAAKRLRIATESFMRLFDRAVDAAKVVAMESTEELKGSAA